ncbi:MAG TPA: sulfite exporter TauE/SafE family protein [Thermoleophilaceae bacterium]|nr:sulfite exporter TauE/SafE family protein [Thermoleophilaceae bacterium]
MTHDPLLLAAFALWCFLVALAGGLAGLVLGNIRLPAALALASSPAAGAGANIGISAVAAAAASSAHIRAGRVNWRLFAWMAPPSIVGAVIGGLVSGELSKRALLAVIGVALLYFGIDLLRPKRAATEAAAAGGHLATIAIGLGVGLLGGLVGLILGTLRMPALIRWLGEPPARAIGTNLAVGFWVGIAGVIGHAPGGVDWPLLAVGGAASIPGALLGARLTGRLSERRLLQAVGCILVVAGTVTLIQSF